MQQFLSAIHGGQFGQVINNYYAAPDCWQALSTNELHNAIKITKQKRQLAHRNKWKNPAVIGGMSCTLFAMVVWVGNLWYLFSDYSRLSTPNSIFSYIAGGLLLASLLCLYFAAPQIRREKIFIDRCNHVIDICEQLIHERKYD
ncbi:MULTISPECIES: hypothetical protein [Pasteurellaceae]|uniref:Uncharacterized protein n=1 Tax=Mannheimia succiniciproducens (strain KCTC 0769BP / MBEL55E) TaxID=221988 RepID=Q65WE2_MANSM|nr:MULTISPECIES: hypothetical protein [Pasteurellaceae]AAU36718.1 unknown [[Mannheimia] succiniciproducens MBEL55E]MDG2958853.1 hypothetical protein [Exercitatus varius]